MPALVVAVKAIYAASGFWAAAKFAAVVVLSRVALYVAISYAANRISRLLTKKPSGGVDDLANSGRTHTVREPAASRKIIYGQARVGGVLVYIGTSGTDKEYLHLLIAHAGHECEEIGTVYLNDVEVPLDGAGNATGTYAGYVTVKKHLGSTTQTYDTDLAAAVGAEWTSAHRLRGICYSYLRLKHSPDLFPAGIPNYSALIKGKKVYDPRTLGTAWSALAALCIRDYLTDTSLGLGAESAEIDDTAVSTAANICDENVNLNPAGTEDRYTINGVIDTAMQPGAVLSDLLGAMAGICPYIGGQFKMKAGAHTASVQSLTIDEARGPIRFTTGDSLRDCFNGVKGVYIADKNVWQPADFPPVVNSTYTTEDGGVRIWRDIALPFTTSSATAQRLAKIELERSRQDFTVQFPAKLTALNVQVGDVVDLTIARYGWTAKLFEVVDFSFVVDDSDKAAPKLGIDLVLRETASGVWDWNSGEETTVDLAPNTTLVSPITVATPGTPTLSTSNFVQSDGTITPRLRVEWTAPSDDRIKAGGYVHIEYKKTADATWLVWSSAIRGNATEDYITDVLAGVGYDVRIRFENLHGVRGAYSATASATVGTDATAPAAPTGLAATAGAGCVVLDWNDNTESDLDHYEVYRNTTNTFPGGSPLWTGYASQHEDYSVTPGTTYYYWLKAADTTGNLSSASTSVSAAASAVGVGVGAGNGSFATIGLNAAGQSTAVTVSKTPSGSSCLVSAACTMENIDSVADSGVTARVYRDSTVIGTFAVFNLAGFSTVVGVPLVIADTGLTPGTSYSYTIKCYRTVSGATIDCQSCSLSAVG